MKTRFYFRWLVLALLLILARSPVACAQVLSTNRGLALIELSASFDYQPVSVAPAALSAPLPLDLSQISNAGLVVQGLQMDSNAQQALASNGFVVVAAGPQTDMAGAYTSLAQKWIPNFITSDSVLHLYHEQFDEVLKAIEANDFFPQIKAMSETLLAGATGAYATNSGDLQEAARRNMAFFSVALSLLGEDVAVPAPVAEVVQAELANISAHAGLEQSPLFNYAVDYSQFIPRGHYTTSQELQEYFLAMMWHGQMAFLLKGSQVPGQALVSVPEARIQTLAGVLFTLDLDQLQNAGQDIADIWNRVYAVTAFFVGVADDLTPYDDKVALEQVFGAQVSVQALTDDATFLALRLALAAMPSPQIYGGTGNCSLPPDATAADLDNVLDETKGVRLMGQRFVPDSCMMQQLVFPVVGLYAGSGDPFTLVQTLGGPIRGFPRGLDVMVVLGSERALDILDRDGDTDYTNYDQSIDALIAQFASFGTQDWTRNLYWGWLYSLQPLLEPCGPGYPAFMQTAAWRDKQLLTALASWAELRHDTILYAKQSYTPITSAVPGPGSIQRGYVEPVPEFYNRLGALTQMTSTGLASLNLLDSTQSMRLDLLQDVLGRLTTIAVAELQGQGPTAADGAYISSFGQVLAPLQAGLSVPQAASTTLAADVATDLNTGDVLEECVGYLKLVVAAYEIPGGQLVLGAGPVFSAYEFKWPMAERLTDEAWTNLLAGANCPPLPDWVGSFTDPVTIFSDPSLSATNALRLQPPLLGPNGVRLQWPAQPAQRYRALYSDDLRTWLLLETPVLANQAQAQILDPGTSATGRRFYKVKPVQ
jgi:hypothetical protein